MRIIVITPSHHAKWLLHGWHDDISSRALVANGNDEIAIILALLREQASRLEHRIALFQALQQVHPEDITQHDIAENARARHQLDKIGNMLKEANASEEVLDHEDE
jgi:hypothetical protein